MLPGQCAHLGQESCPTTSWFLYSIKNLHFQWVGITECTRWKGALEGSNPTCCSREDQDVQAIINRVSHSHRQTDFTTAPEFSFSLYLTGISFSPSCVPVHLCLCLFHTQQEEFVIPPPWMTSSPVLWGSLNPHLYFTFTFLIEKGPHLPWKWNINMPKRLSTRWTGKFNKSPSIQSTAPCRHFNCSFHYSQQLHLSTQTIFSQTASSAGEDLNPDFLVP